jgi:hypothetical protein
MKVVCTCGERMYFTGESNPTIEPIRWYACKNKHMKRVFNDPTPDWGNYDINRQWRDARQKKKTHEYGGMP